MGWSGVPGGARPSMVVTAAPAHCSASIVHDFIARPFTCTMQAPHCVVSQPTCVPVRPRCSLRNSTSIVRPSTSPRTARPLTVIETVGILPAPRFRDPRLNDGVRCYGFSTSANQTMPCSFDRLPDLHRGHWYSNLGHAERRECVQNSAYNRRRGANCRPLAHASDAERIQTSRDFRAIRLERRQVSRVRHSIVAVAANQRLAAAVVDHGLHEGLADALRRTAMDLTLDEQGVNDSAAIVHHHVTQQRNVPGLGIDLDHGNVRTIVEEHVLGIEEAGFVETGDHAEWQVVAKVRIARDVGEGHVRPTLWHGKHKAATPLDDNPYDQFSSLLAQTGNLRFCAWVRYHAEQTVLIN